MKSTAFPRIFPFALFMAFIGVEELARVLKGAGLIHFEDPTLYLLYPVKALSVFFTLLIFRAKYSELRVKDLTNPSHAVASVFTGLLVFLLWVNMDWSFGTLGAPKGFNPNVFQDDSLRTGIVIARLAGAAIVVPIMEELFWRSFLIRYVINSDFAKVPIGLFTWPSFLISTVLFGLEHNLFLAGMMAGIAYNLLLYYTRSIALCIVAHAITNLALGIYVLQTGRWYFW
ncbi:MAG: abortive infection [Geobacteraceae bacterium]|nr:MAG: abortive infection [Geobacteraceae bacterium]